MVHPLFPVILLHNSLLFLLVAVTIKETFDDLKLWRKEFLMHAGIAEHEADSYPFVVLGNKVDKEEERAVAMLHNLSHE